MKNLILKTMMYISVFTFLVSACAIDSDSYIPMITCFASFGYAVLFGLANKERIFK